MTYEEAARILDPETSREALLPYAYDPQYQQMLLRKACVIAANALESYAALVASCPEGDLIMPGGEMLKIKILSLPCISYEPPRLADVMPVNQTDNCIKIQYSGEELTVQEICKRLERAEKRVKVMSPCDLCGYNPPSSGDGKPCSLCPAEPKWSVNHETV